MYINISDHGMYVCVHQLVMVFISALKNHFEQTAIIMLNGGIRDCYSRLLLWHVIKVHM